MGLVGKYIEEKIDVNCDEETGLPIDFLWRNKKYYIVEILRSWQDWGFSKTGPKRKTWRHRRHRNYFRVKTEDEKFMKFTSIGNLEEENGTF